MPGWLVIPGPIFGPARTAPVTSSSSFFSDPLNSSATSVTVWSVMPDRILTGSRVLSGRSFQRTATSGRISPACEADSVFVLFAQCDGRSFHRSTTGFRAWCLLSA